MHNYHMHRIGDNLHTRTVRLDFYVIPFLSSVSALIVLSTPESTANGGRLRAISSARL